MLRNAQGVVRKTWPAFALAAVLILTGFGWALPNDPHYQDETFQADEGAAVWAVEQISFPLFYPRRLTWGTALFYQVYLLKTVLLGWLPRLHDAWIYVIGRSLVLASALGAITMTFLIGRKLFDEGTGRWAAALLAVLPGFAVNAHYFKTDVPMAFWLLLALWALHRMLESERRSSARLAGFLVGYAASVKYSAGLLFPVGLLAILAAGRAPPGGRSWRTYAGWSVLGFLFGEPWALYVPKLVRDLLWVASINTQGIPYHLGRPPAWLDYPLHVLPFSMTVPVLAAAAIGAVLAAVQRGRALLPVWAFCLLYTLLLSRDNTRLVRYTVPLLPFGALFAAHLVRRIGIASPRWLAAAAGGSLLLYPFLYSFSYVRVMARTDPRIQASRWIEENLPRTPPVPVCALDRLDVPRLELMGYESVNVRHDLAALKRAESPYLILSEMVDALYQQAIEHHPVQRAFYEYVREHYVERKAFEHSQVLLGIDSKAGRHLPQDWLHPNPRIAILERRRP